eukprot:3756790-Ditylum_brightwellii.AAC.1
MHTYQQVVSYMLMFQTEMPPDMPIDAVALGSWKLYMGQLAINIAKQFSRHLNSTMLSSKALKIPSYHIDFLLLP